MDLIALILLFLALLLVAPLLAGRLAARWGWSKSRRRLISTIAVLLVLAPLFWDWLPTIWLHSYYCAKEGGLVVHRTPDAWRKENPGVAETLVRRRLPPQIGPDHDYKYQLNQRISWHVRTTERALGLRQRDDRLVDSKTGRTLVRLTDFWSGQASGRLEGAKSLRDLKFWMYRNSCEKDGEAVNRKRFAELSLAFEMLGEEK